MKKMLVITSLLLSTSLFSAQIKSDKGGMDFPDLKIERVESATYMALASKSGEAYVFGLANDVILDAQKGMKQNEVLGFYDNLTENKLEVELYNVSFSDKKLVVKPTYQDFTIFFTKDETNKILKAVKEEK